MDFKNFDASAIAPRQAFELLPPGKYTAVISDSEEKRTKKNDGSYLALELTIVDGEHAGRKLFDNLNLNNPTAKACEIAQQTLSSICRAVGVMRPERSSDLHDLPLVVTVKVVPAKDQYEAKNEVKGYAVAGGASEQPATPAIGGAAPVVVATGAGGPPPWSRK